MKTLLNKILRAFIFHIQDALTPILDELIDQAKPSIKRQIEEAIADVDIERHVEREVADYDLDGAIEHALNDYNLERVIENALEDFDIEGKVESEAEDALDDFDVDERMARKIEALVRKNIGKVLREMAEQTEEVDA